MISWDVAGVGDDDQTGFALARVGSSSPCAQGLVDLFLLGIHMNQIGFSAQNRATRQDEVGTCPSQTENESIGRTRW
jgi:hypothetical protein